MLLVDQGLSTLASRRWRGKQDVQTRRSQRTGGVCLAKKRGALRGRRKKLCMYGRRRTPGSGRQKSRGNKKNKK